MNINNPETLAQELAQAHMHGDETAFNVAVCNCVMFIMQQQMRQADALEKIADAFTSNIHPNGAIKVEITANRY